MSLLLAHPSIEEIDYTNTDIIITDYWVVASREENQIRITETSIESSVDNGISFSNSIVFADVDKILHGYLFDNGNFVFFTIDNKIYLTDILLNTITEKTLFDTDGTTPYVFHTPQNALFAGAYLECESHSSYVDGGVYSVANYCNSAAIDGGRGASAVIVPTTNDYGLTWKLSYKFGENLVYGDNGTALGGSDGDLLGDASNSNVSRHAHNIEYNIYNQKYYMNTGDKYWDFTTPDMDEVGWYEGTYNSNTNNIDWIRIDFGKIIQETDNLKATGMFFTPTHIYWGSDANPVTVPDNQGIFRSPINTFSDTSTHELVYSLNTDEVIIDMKLDYNTNIVLATLGNSETGVLDKILAVKDFGHGEAQQYQFTGTPTLLRINSINNLGYFRLDMDGFQTQQNQTLFIKLGEDLFNNQ
jgi:hypothetical protein